MTQAAWRQALKGVGYRWVRSISSVHLMHCRAAVSLSCHWAYHKTIGWKDCVTDGVTVYRSYVYEVGT